MAEKGRQYVAIDAKSFYASVECVERRQGFHQPVLFCISSHIILAEQQNDVASCLPEL